MPLVNLISEQRAIRRSAIRKTRLFMLSWIVSMGAGLAALGGLIWQTDNQHDRLADLKSRSAGMQAYQHALREGRTELNELRPKLTTLQTASRATEGWLRMLRHLGARSPEGVWLTAVRVQEATGKEQGLEVRFTGYARDQSLVGVMMQRLNEFPEFADTELRYTTEKETGNNVGVEFEIVARLQGKGPADSARGGVTVDS